MNRGRHPGNHRGRRPGRHPGNHQDRHPDNHPDRHPDNHPDRHPGNHPDRHPDNHPDRHPDNHPDRHPGNHRGRQPDNHPDRQPGNHRGRHPGRHPGDHPDRHPDNHPDNHPDRHPGDHPDRQPGNHRGRHPGRQPQRFCHQQGVADQTSHRPRNSYKLTEARLRDLLTKDPNEITLRLASNLDALKELLNQNKDYALAEIFLKVIKKSMQSISLKEKNNQILISLLHSSFPSNVSQMIVKIDLSDEDEEHVEFLQNLLYILNTILILNPSEYLSSLQITGAMNVILQNVGESRSDDVGNLLVKYEELQNLLQVLNKQQRNQKTGKDLPPEDFRNLEIIPTAKAIHSKENIFLRKNKVKGAYDDVDHYLDVQFRLMREDFFGPLRHGIQQYLKFEDQQKHQRIDDLRFYHQVHILHPLCTSDGIAYKVFFNMSHQQINWDQSKRLIYGSLVCLTPDDFQTVYFAIVTNREKEELKKGLVDLIFFSTCEEISSLSSTTVFIMAETTAYFGAYHPILKALKEIKDDNMPFQDYIIYGKSDVEPPKYLIQQGHYKMDLTCLIDDHQMNYDSKRDEVKFDVNPTNNLSLNILHDTWPSSEVLKLNDSQHQALQNALTKEFSLTQGPPGTGKTYIGLKIVRALCYNCNRWRMDRKSPMLIVCYTNQALDKFLEGITSFLKGGILRVGGRSKCEVLDQYLLKNVRKGYPHLTNDLYRSTYSTRDEMRVLQLEIERFEYLMRNTKKGILQENILKSHMGQFYNWLANDFKDIFGHENRSKISLLTQWLGYGNFELYEEEVEDRFTESEPFLFEEDEVTESQELFLEEDEVTESEELPPEEDEVTESEELSPEEENVVVYTEMDFIENNRMIDDDDDSLDENISPLEIRDFEFFDLKLDDFDDFDREKKLSSDAFERTRREKNRLKNQLERLLNSKSLLEDKEVNQIRCRDMWRLNMEKRWKLYRRWVASYCQELQDRMVQKEVEYNELSKAYKELQQYKDGQIMKKSLIVGMTSTAAAKYHALLQEIQPKIIIVEEAAEILEAHVVTALNSMCEQLILIGDHKQLQPNPNVYELARNYNLAVSLFERMVLNKCHVKCLTHQHRMRPEISQLLRPIYSELEDHVSVNEYENIKGVDTNLYFIQHDEREKTSTEGRSYSNPHEASFLVELCKYLLKQGYRQSQITILTTYTSQLFHLKRLMADTAFKGVQLTVVDNYQGEENDIILLSLVRNNADKKVGFLKINNRVCVALSRAKMGFYVIGNFEILSEQSELWNDILLMLKSKDLVGHSLSLHCSNHPNRQILVREKSDFDQTPEGGCLEPCVSRLKCGHVCKRLCHPVDDHDEYKCLEKCREIAPDCPQNHKCNHRCYIKCGPCKVMVTKIMPECKHQKMMACSIEPDTLICQEACEKPLPCGHRCEEFCGSFCTIRCCVYVDKTFPCRHTVRCPCFNQYCTEACTKTLDCGHQCSSTCGKCSERRIHAPCSHGCRRLLVCGHQCSNKQCNVCSPCLKSCENRCNHSICIKSCGELCTPCRMKCNWRCKHYQCKRYCHEPCDRPRCDKACLKHLKCGHKCVGLCGERCPHLCRVCDKKELTEIFFGSEEENNARFVELEDCGHIFEKSGLDEWMSRDTDGEILLNVCPKCKVPIRQNLRYGQIIKKTLLDIDMVKERLIGDRQQIRVLDNELSREINKLNADDRRFLEREKRRLTHDQLTLSYLNSFSYRISFLSAIRKLLRNNLLTEDSSLQMHCEKFCQWLLNHEEIFSETELEETEMEVERIGKIHQFYKVKNKVMHMSISSESNINRLLIERGLKLLTSEDYASVKDEVAKVEKDLSETISAISKQERIAVVKAMGLPPGHWFKCPKGHIYVIGECGGATERGKCPDCKSTIGGENHALAAGNSLAGEMDGAQHAAWSDQANMANYQF